MATATAYKVQIKLGQAEFAAEGPEETVKAQLAEFLTLAPRFSDHRNGHEGANGNGHHAGMNGSNGSNGKGHVETSPLPTPSHMPMREPPIDPALLKRIFSEGKSGLISLRTLPNGDEKKSDAIFLILLGYLLLRDQSEVKASELLLAAKQSGLTLSRLDDTLDKYDALVARGGIKRGSRYALTNPGIEYAESVALRLFG